MRIVLDTNLWVSGLLWRGLPWRLLQLAEAGLVELCVAPSMLTELADVLAYERFQPRLQQLGLVPEDLMVYALRIVTILDVPEAKEATMVAADPDDDIFLHTAVAAGAAYIVSGDHHLLDLGEYVRIPILTIQEFLARVPGVGELNLRCACYEPDW